MNQFKKNVSNYIKYEKIIKSENNKLKNIKKKKNTLEKHILKYILNNQLPHKIKINSDYINVKENKTKSQLNKKFLINCIKNYFNIKSEFNNKYCDELANDIYNFIDSSRSCNTKFSLKKI